MKTYTIRLDDQFFELLENLSKKTKSPKSLIVKRALLLYKEELEKQEMLKNLLESAKELAEDPTNLRDIQELEGTVKELGTSATYKEIQKKAFEVYQRNFFKEIEVFFGMFKTSDKRFVEKISEDDGIYYELGD